MKTSIKKTILFLTLYLLSCNAYMQNKTIDSLQKVLLTQNEDTNKVNTLHQLGSNFRFIGNADKSLRYANEALLLSEKIDFKKGELLAYYGLGDVNHALLRNSQEALKYWSKGLEISEKYKDLQYISAFTWSIAEIHNSMSNYPELLKHLLKSLRLFENLNDKKNIPEVFNYLGVLYFNQKKYPEALRYYNLCLKRNEDINELGAVGRGFNNIGTVYLKQGNFELALENTLKGLNTFKKMGEKAPDWGLPFSYQCMADIYITKGDEATKKNDKENAKINYNNALDYYLKSHGIWEKINRKDAVTELYICIGEVYFKQNKLSLANSFLKKVSLIEQTTYFSETKQKAYLYLSKSDSIKGNWKAGYYHYKQYIIYKDILENKENIKAITEYQMQYEFDKKEALSKAEQEKKYLEQKRIRNLQYLSLSALLLIALGLYYNNRQKQKAKAAIEKAYSELAKTHETLKATQAQLIQSEKLASLGELTAGIAHEIQNPLNFVNNFSELSAELIEEMESEFKAGKPDYAFEIAADIKLNLSKINHHGQRASSIVKGMLEHSRVSTGVREPTDINALADEYLRLSYHGWRAKDNSFNATIETHFDPDLPLVSIVPQDIGRVLLNLINNAFYAVHQRATVRASLADAHLADAHEPTGARKGRPYQPTVTISTQKTGDHIIIKVMDNGNGIPETITDKIFQPFFTTKPTGQGTGLGLSLAYDIVTKGHGGTLNVSSIPGATTTFELQLPLQ